MSAPGTQAPGGHGPGGHAAGALHETSWDAVRARVIGHLAAQERDRARARAMAGDFAGCAARYEAAAAEVGAVPIAEDAPRRIRDAFAGALARDAALCAALAEGRDPPVPPTPVAALYARAAAARRAGTPWDPGAPPVVPTLSLSVSDPAARTALRATLTEAWADTVDPLAPTDPWGYWEPAEALRIHARLWAEARGTHDRAGGAAGGGAAANVGIGGAAGGAAGAGTGGAGSPGAAAGVAHGTADREPWTVTAAELATPPTGDTYVDSAGLPGPRALVPADVSATPGPAEQALAATLAAATPADVVGKLAAGLSALESAPDGGRRARGAEAAVLRRLARAGAYLEAAQVARRWRAERPFDRDSINRAGVVRGIEGRLLLLAGDPAAEAVLDEASAASRAFLSSLPARP